ncbi:radical SAM protein [Nocardia aobensis]|uniref:Radical SAM protein n=1 Tax=Nocardia aobensis TaxID=257277 RepID=A0ABW6NZ55_9NOCA
MTSTDMPMPSLRTSLDGYGHARMPRGGHVPQSQKIDRVAYGRFRNVYLYITEACQLRCEHCYMGDRLDRALKMPLPRIVDTLTTWRRLGGSKLTILGGEPTLHPHYCEVIRLSRQLGYEHVITTTNAQKPALRSFRQLTPNDFAYVQVSPDGGSRETHGAVRGEGTFDEAMETTRELCERGFDTRIICTVNKANERDVLQLLDIADVLGVSLVKFHVFSTIGTGHRNSELAMSPPEWVDLCDSLNVSAPQYNTRVWYQPTYARRDQMQRYADEGYQGCIGRTLDRISIFPDGRCYVCSYLFDTDLYFARMVNGRVELNSGANEFDLFTGVLADSSCEGCKVSGCMGGCPGEKVVMGQSSCTAYEDIVPVCRLWKSSAKPEE